MMYCEFVEGTGCRDNEHNRKVFENLEAMYMNTDMTKQEIYEYGKKLVDNSKTAEQIEFEERIKAEIAMNKRELDAARANAVTYREWAKSSDSETERDYWKSRAKKCEEKAKHYRFEIAALKWVIE